LNEPAPPWRTVFVKRQPGANFVANAAPGATPVAYGNWRRCYMIVLRKAVTMIQDPYSAGFCMLFKFESRIGGTVVCANAARLMRIR
jgi:HK97 family phage major capsid protein